MITFQYSGDSLQQLVTSYGSYIEKEYSGDLVSILPSSETKACLQVDRCVIAGVQLRRVSANVGLKFHRSKQQSSLDARYARMLLFARRGEVNIMGLGSPCKVRQGELIIHDLDIPLRVEISPYNGSFETLLLEIPTNILVSTFPALVGSANYILSKMKSVEIFTSLFQMIIRDQDSSDPGLAKILLSGLMEIAASSIAADNPDLGKRKRIADSRISDIKLCISRHLTDPNLDAKQVAAECGISERYLHHLLRQAGATFSKLLWQQRIETSRDWLGTNRLAHLSIAEIARSAGFKSITHFSRAFKASIGCSPREFRVRESTIDSEDLHKLQSEPLVCQ
jgi:AraC-like DNA-binding protein